MSVTWEYEVMALTSPSLDIKATKEQLNTSGKYSWELVTVITLPSPIKAYSETNSPFFAVFKRQKPN